MKVYILIYTNSYSDSTETKIMNVFTSEPIAIESFSNLVKKEYSDTHNGKEMPQAELDYIIENDKIYWSNCFFGYELFETETYDVLIKAS